MYAFVRLFKHTGAKCSRNTCVHTTQSARWCFRMRSGPFTVCQRSCCKTRIPRVLLQNSPAKACFCPPLRQCLLHTIATATVLGGPSLRTGSKRHSHCGMLGDKVALGKIYPRASRSNFTFQLHISAHALTQPPSPLQGFGGRSIEAGWPL